jgi:hypothetical protein
MHERYFYLAEALSLVYLAQRPRRWYVTAGVLLGGFLAYRAYLFGGSDILSTAQTGVLLGVCLGIVFGDCWKGPAQISCSVQPQTLPPGGC